MKNILYRDDDVNVYTCPHLFKKLHEEFIKNNKTHTVAVVMKDLWENHALFWYLATVPLLTIGLHGWEHKDYSVQSYENCNNDIKKSLKYWEENSIRMTGKHKTINTFFAPWNREGKNIKLACEMNGLKFCNIKKGEWGEYNIKSFHHWYITMNNKENELHLEE